MEQVRGQRLWMLSVEEACQDLSQVSRLGCPFCNQCTGWPRYGQLRLVMSRGES